MVYVKHRTKEEDDSVIPISKLRFFFTLRIRSLVIVAVALLATFDIAAARSPISLRILGGLTGAARNSLSSESGVLAPVLGVGIRYSLSERRSVTLDFERIHRSASDALPVNSVNYYPITLSYQFNLGPSSNHAVPFVQIGLSGGPCWGSRTNNSAYPGIGTDVGESTGGGSSSHQLHWGGGLLVGGGVALSLSERFRVSSQVSCRYLSQAREGFYVYPATGREDSQQHPNQMVNGNNPYHSSGIGIEGKLAIEFQL